MPLLKKCKKFFVSFDFPELSCDVFSPVLSVPHTELPLAPPPADQFPALARLPLLLTAQHNADFGEKNKSQLFHGDGSGMLFWRLEMFLTETKCDTFMVVGLWRRLYGVNS